MAKLPGPARRSFRPPFCPNPECDSHEPKPEWRAHKYGFFTRPSDSVRIQRFFCPDCGRTFSSQTFSTSYWLRRRNLLIPITAKACEGAALRQIARLHHASPNTVARHIARAGRHCLLFHRALLKDLTLDEPLVVDGFETFEYSQFYPFHVNIAAGGDSWFIYHFTDSPLRRKGCMTDGQKKKRKALEEAYGRPNPRAVELGMAALIRPLLKRLAPNTPLILHSDDHPAYRRSLKRLRREASDCPIIDHHVTSSTERRTYKNPLFPVNLADLLLRHCGANHRRETIAFSKRRQGALERMAVFTVWRNCIKKRQEKKSWPTPTAAKKAGLARRRWTWRRILGRRLFPEHEDLPPEWTRYYYRKVKTLIMGDAQTEHSCRYTT